MTAELVPSSTRTWCAYKGEASYFSTQVGGRLVPDIAWSYPDPRQDADRVRDLTRFFDERVDVTLDGERGPGPGHAVVVTGSPEDADVVRESPSRSSSLPLAWSGPLSPTEV